MNKIIYNLTKLKTLEIKNNMPSVEPIPMITKSKSIFSKIKTMLSVRQWKINKDYILKINDELFLIVPKGFEFDWASIPRIFWTILSPTGPLLIGSLIHDFGYRYNGLLTIENDEIFFTQYSKTEIDRIFRIITEKVNDMNILAFICEKMVNVFGIFAWNSNRKLNCNVFFDNKNLNIKKGN